MICDSVQSLLLRPCQACATFSGRRRRWRRRWEGGNGVVKDVRAGHGGGGGGKEEGEHEQGSDRT